MTTIIDTPEPSMPSNISAEKAILGAVLHDPRMIEKISAWIRSPEAFWYNKNQRVWISIHELYRKGIGIDIITVANKYKEKYNEDIDTLYLTKLVEESTRVENSEYHARIVWERHIQREVIKVSKKLEAASKLPTDKIAELLSLHRRYMEELSNLTPSKDRSMEIIANSAAEAIIKGTHIIKWGEPHLDDFAGGLTRGEFTALGGRPGNGKTTLMMNMIDLLVKKNPGIKIMVFNREMTNQSAISKFMVMNSDKLESSVFRKTEVDDNMAEEINRMKDIIIKKYADVRMYDDIVELDETMREIRRYEPDVVFDDYIQLIKINGKRSRDRRFEIEDIVNEYKWILKRVDASGVLVSQLSRDIEKRIDSTPVMADYSEGGTIEQGAETCMFVYYPYYFDPNEHSPYQNEVIVKKARYGTIGTYKVGFSGSKCKFFISPEEISSINS